MSRQWEPRKQTVELQPSRIRRDPAPDQPRGLAKIEWDSREWEIRFAIAGVILFALGIAAVAFDIGEVLSI